MNRIPARTRRTLTLVPVLLLTGIPVIYASDNGGAAEAADHLNLYPLLFVVLSLIIGVFTRHWLRKSPIPYTVSLLIFGLLLGIMNRLGWFGALELGALSLDLNFLQEAVNWAGQIDPHLILFVFLPPLIFEAAFGMDFHTFKKTVGNASLLAIPGLILALVLTAAIVMGLRSIGLGFDSWSWALALLFGTIVSATDPVAVVALLKELGASKRLSTLIEGESLLNDGTAIVIFSVILMAVTGGGSDTSPLLEFFRVALGGLLVGLIIGWLTIRFIKEVFNDALVEISLIIAAAYLTFFIAEDFLQVSGVLGLVALGLMMGSAGKTRISPKVSHFLHEFWEIAAFIANTLIFIIVGVVIASELQFSGKQVLILLLLYLGIHLVRALVIALFYPGMKRIGYGLTRNDAVVLWYGALRGAVGLALALMVAGEEAIPLGIRQDLLFYTAGIVTLTLVLNATTIKYLIQALGMTRIAPACRAAIEGAENELRQAGERALVEFREDRYIKRANWNEVRKYLPRASEGEGLHPEPEAQLSEFRLRLLQKEKESYWSLFNQGMLSAVVVRRLEESVNLVMDHGGEKAISARKDLEENWKLPVHQVRLHRWPLLGPWLKRNYFERLSYVLEEAQAYVYAQEDCMELLSSWRNAAGEWSIGERGMLQLENEIEENRITGFTFLRNMRRFYPEMYRAISTRQAARALLNVEEDRLKALRNKGQISSDESEKLEAGIEARMKQLQNAPPVVELAKPEEMIRQLGWLKDVEERAVNRVIEAFEAKLFPHGARLITENDDSTSGLFVVVRGKVKVEIRGVTMDVLGQGSMIGEMAVLTGYPRTASVVAATPVETLWIQTRALRKIMHESKALENALWEFASMRFAMNLLGHKEPYNQWEQNKFIQWLSMGEIRVPDEAGRIVLKNRVGVLLMGHAIRHEKGKEDERIAAPASLSGNKYTFSPDSKVFVREK